MTSFWPFFAPCGNLKISNDLTAGGIGGGIKLERLLSLILAVLAAAQLNNPYELFQSLYVLFLLIPLDTLSGKGGESNGANRTPVMVKHFCNATV